MFRCATSSGEEAMSGNTGAAIPWPNFQGSSILAGTSPSGRVTVYYDAALGQPAQQNAQALLSDADRVVQWNDHLFGTNTGSVNVIIFALGDVTDGTGGADHASCDYMTGNNIEVCAAFGNPARVSGLFEAELSECNMGGNLCGVSTGEALSRWCAAIVSNNALSDFATAPTWYSSGAQDYVGVADPTDQNPVSTGCGMAFISWLMSQNIALTTIAQGLVALGANGTFAQLYGNLTNNDPGNAYLTFMGAVQGLPTGVTNDDPFNAMPAAQPSLATMRRRSHRLRRHGP
jgi:hypothetical protein